MEIKLDEQQARGTRILYKDTAHLRRKFITECVTLCQMSEFNEIVLPSLEPFSVYEQKTGAEIESQMYVFPDKKGRKLCLRPEGTATCQVLARTIWKHDKDVKIFYETRCWRYERPQAGRYREFTQFGVEWLWPRDPKAARESLLNLSYRLTDHMLHISGAYKKVKSLDVASSVKRGLAYYVEDGFEISVPDLGAQKQVVGGGSYAEGIGFAIGIDRIMEIAKI